METEQKTAFIFPGQGLTGKEIISYYQRLVSINELAVKKRLSQTQEVVNKIHGSSVFDINQALEDKDSSLFKDTSFIQPIVYTLSILSSEVNHFKIINEESVLFVAGHSLGEYAALTETGVFPFEKGLEITTLRGQAMQEAALDNPSALISILGLSEEEIKTLCHKTGAEISLLNAPKLVVVGSNTKAIPDIESLSKEMGAKRVTRLETAAAFHTSFMTKAAFDRLDPFLKEINFADALINIVSNLTGRPTRSGYAIKNHLVESMVNPVRWADGIQFMKNAGVENFIEVGPGTSLTSLNAFNEIPKGQTKNILDLAA